VEEKLYQNAEWMREKYHAEHLHVDDIAKLAECSTTTIITWLPKLKIPLREQGIVPIYFTEEQLERLRKEDQQIGYSADLGYPDLPFIVNDPSKLSLFLKEALGWRGFFRKVACVDQYDDKVTVIQHYRVQNRMNYGYTVGPKIRVFDVGPVVDYKTYIISEEWRQKSLAIRKRVGKCQMCGARSFLSAHHNTYKTLGEEDEYDITVLCDGCHKLFHTRSKVLDNPGPREWIDLSAREMKKLKWKEQRHTP
jgi:hypothetical protein